MADARHNTLFSALNIPFCFVQTRKYSLTLPWTTPNFQKETAPVNFIWKFTEGQGMKSKDSYLLLTFLMVCLVEASCFGIAAPWMGRPRTRFEIQKI